MKNKLKKLPGLSAQDWYAKAIRSSLQSSNDPGRSKQMTFIPLQRRYSDKPLLQRSGPQDWVTLPCHLVQVYRASRSLFFAPEDLNVQDRSPREQSILRASYPSPLWYQQEQHAS